jgi:hypothetical protein
LDLFAPHYFLPFLPFLALLAADGARSLYRRTKAAAVMVGILTATVALGAVVEFWRHPDEPEGWRPVARAIDHAARAGDAVLLPNLAARLCYTLEKKDSLPVFHLTMVRPGQTVVTAEMVAEVLPLLGQRFRRVWYIDYYPARSDPTRAMERAARPPVGWVASSQIAADPRLSLKVWNLRDPFEVDGLSPLISFPDGPQHPSQLRAGWFPCGGDECWISGEVEAILPPSNGAPLELLATVPVTLFGGRPPAVTVSMNGAPVETRIAADGRVVLGDAVDVGNDSAVAIKIQCDRTFVPDEIFHDGDRSRKCLLVRSLGWRRP